MPRSSTPSSRAASRPGRSKAKGRSAGLAGMLSALPLGNTKARKGGAGGRGRKGAGLALLTAAAGFAVSNRDKLGGLLNRSKRQPEPVAPAGGDSAQPTP
jgi:hypothetical protein